jgi:signal transduction histidine kinase/ligand-binding sensor domain-containing protein
MLALGESRTPSPSTVQAANEKYDKLIHTVWTTENGLPQNSVTSIIQTRDGYLWVATFGGLARFDGQNFTLFNTGNSPGLGGNRIIGLNEDRAGGLWAALEGGGLAHYSKGKFTTYTIKEGLPDSAVQRISEDRDGNLWASTAAGTARFSGGRFLTEPTLFGLPNRHLIQYFGARDGSIWLGPPEGLTRYYEGTLTTYMPRPIFIREAEDGSVWVYTNDRGLARFHRGAWTYYPINDELPSREARPVSVISGRNDTICILTREGLTRFKDGKKVSFIAIKDLPNFWTAFEDREGNLWVSGAAAGLHRFKQAPIVAYSAGNGLADESFLPITDDGAGGLWIGSTKLYHFQAGALTNDPENVATWSLLRDRQGSLWIGAYGALHTLKDGRYTGYRFFDGTPVTSLYEDRQGTIWIGTLKGHVSGSPGGLYFYKDGTFTPYRTSDGLVHNNVRFITEDRQGALWIGTEGGISRFKDGKFTNYTTESGLSNNYIREIYEDSDGALWIGTYGGGLNRFKDGRFVQITIKDGLFDNIVSRILEDENGNFWMSCNRGIYRASRQQLNDFADGKIGSITCVSYGVADGMKTSECNGGGQPAGWKDREGKLWFPTIKGVVVIDPNKINPLPPPVTIEQVLIDKKSMSLRQRAEAPPGKGELEIHYTALSFVAPEKTRFKYRLESYDEGWVDADTRRVAYYTNIPPGRYRFRVIASNNDGVWNETGATFEFRLRPHFYQTAWFFALAAFTLLGALVSAYRHRITKLHRRHAEQQAFSRQLIESQENERKRIAAELHDSLGQSLIIIRNRALLSLRKPEDHERAMEQMNEIASASAQAISEVKEIAYNLRPYQLDRLGLTKALESMIRGLSDSCSIKFNAEIDSLDGLLSKDDEINIYRIVQESVNNIIKHSEATEAGIAIKKHARERQITIHDNGKGFAAGASDSDGSRRHGFGLIGLAERGRMLGAKYKLHSAPGRGTTISIKLGLEERKDGN